ncbi:MAG: TetR/AcrR family transcriptional regulator C-terminal domain-containing protein [Christensenellales bacterium]|jgi:AcrR family transcriptional regulator
MAKFAKMAIVHTFVELLDKKPLSKITVTEIIEACEISRNTFYYYFQDIYDLVDYLFSKEIEKLHETTATSDTLSDECEIVLDLLIKNKRALKHIYESIKKDQIELYLFKALDKAMLDFIKKQFQDTEVSEEDIHFLARYHKYALVGFITDWLSSKSDENLVNLLTRISNLSEESIRNHLKHSVAIIEESGPSVQN